MQLTPILIIVAIVMLVPVTINAIIQLQLTYELAKGVSELERLEQEAERIRQEQEERQNIPSRSFEKVP